MSARCQVTGRTPGFGNTVSHSHRRSARRWKPNMQTKTYYLASENRASKSLIATASRPSWRGCVSEERRSDGPQRHSAPRSPAQVEAVPRAGSRAGPPWRVARCVQGELVMPLATTHRQVAASIGVEVDEGIRDLLEALWSRGMETEFSCQGDHDSLAHICFTHAADAWRFMEAPGDFLITEGETRAWVDFPAHLTAELTQYWVQQD
jgi:ribosomal protein L28